MNNPVSNYWNIRLEACRTALERNRFNAVICADREAARALVLDQLLPELAPQSVSWGGSLTFRQSGLYDALRIREDLQVMDTYDKSRSREEILELRRQALLCDLFFMSTNALTADGRLVNLDMIGNRVAALTYGPRHVIVLAGRNKIVPGLEEAFTRIRDYASPVNAMRLDKKTPCVATGTCHDCRSPERICNTWTITEKSHPADRVHVILINEDLGF